MARTSVKATYAFDVASVEALGRLARRWAVSKSEALRRAIRAAEVAAAPRDRHDLDLLDRLQRAVALSPAKARTWAQDVRAERHAGTPRPARRGRR